MRDLGGPFSSRSPFGRRRAGGDISAPADLSIGALTLTGAGGVATAAPDGTYGPYTVAGGTLTPNTSPVAAGTYDVGGVSVQAVASEYSVSSSAEYDAALADVPAGGGRTIRFRAATYDWGSKTLASGLSFTEPLVITAEAGAVFSDSLSVTGCTNVTLRGLRVIWDGANPEVFAEALALSGNGMIVEDCEISGIVYDPLGTPAANNDFLNVARAISVQSGGGITIRRNNIHDVDQGVVATVADAGGLIVTDNEIYRTYSDCAKFVVTGSAMTAPIRYERNVLHSFMGDPADPRNPHIDCLQFISNASNDGQYLTDVQIRQNVAFMDASSRGRGIQGLVSFGDGGYSLALQDPVIAGNVLLIDGNHHVAFKVDGAVASQNIAANPSADWDTTGNALIRFYDSTGNVLLRGNITDLPPTLTGTAIFGQEGDVELGSKGVTIAYTTAFDGPTFPAADFAAVKTAWSVQSGAAGAIGSGYGTYGMARNSAGWSYDPAREAGPVAAAPEAFAIGDWGLEDTGEGGTLAVTITDTPFSNWSPITDLEYRVGAGAWTSAGVIGDFDITGLTDDVSASVQIRAVNAEGTGAASDTKSATPTDAGYLINAVDFASGVSAGTTAFSAAGGKQATIAFWVRAPSAWPSSGIMMRMTDGTGGTSASLTFASDGRLNLNWDGTSHVAGTGTFAGDTWYQVLISIDTTSGARRFQFYVNEVLKVSSSSVPDDKSLSARGRCYISEPAANLQFADVWWTWGVSLDFSDPAERAKFAADADKGADGSIPTGSAPDLFLSGATGSWHVNKGTSGGLTLSGGSLTTAGSVPA